MQYGAAAKGTRASKSWAHLLKGAGLVHKETGLTLESAELGRVKITDSFVDSDTARLRLHIECPADRKGRLPVTLSPIGNVVDNISSRSVVAKEGLLHKGDIVIGVDGMALGQRPLEEALSKDKAVHTLIVHRTDAQLTSIVMKTPPSAISSTYAAPLFRVQVDLTRAVGRSDTVRLGLNVNQHNAILYIVPGSPAAYEGTLAVGDVLVELSGGIDNSATDLQACSGPCRVDAQCVAGLLCFPRQPGKETPGCFGETPRRDGLEVLL